MARYCSVQLSLRTRRSPSYWATSRANVRGGSGYFPLRLVVDHLRSGQLHYVPGTPVMTSGVYFAFADVLRGQSWFEEARGRLAEIAQDEQRLAREIVDGDQLKCWTGLPQQETPAHARPRPHRSTAAHFIGE